MIRLTCENCSAVLEVRGGSVRAQASCPCCGASFRTPKEGAPVQFPAFTEGRWYRCPQCSAETFFDSKLSALACSFCGSGKLLQVPDLTGSFEEQFFIPFLVNPDAARSRIQAYLGSHLWMPAEVREQLRTALAMPHYVPSYQLSCSVRTSLATPGEYDDDDGEDATGGSVAAGVGSSTDAPAAAAPDAAPAAPDASAPRTEPKPASGLTSVARRWKSMLTALMPAQDAAVGEEEDSHAGYYNERVPCSRGITADQVKRLLPYNYRLLRPFRPLMLGSAKLERTAETEEACWERVTESVIGSELKFFQKQHAAKAAAGDDDEGPDVRVVFLDKKARLILLPVYVIGYHYQGRYHRLLINGQTGKLVEVVHVSATRLGLVVGGFGVTVLALVLALLSSDLGTFEEERQARARQMEALGTIPIHLQVTPNATFGSLFSERNLGSLEPASVLQKTWNAGEDPLGDLVRTAETQHQQGHLDRAREAFAQLVQDYPDDPRALYHWARYKLLLGEAAEAEPRVAALLQRAPAFTRGYEVLARCKLQLGRYSEAVEWFEKAHERSAPDPFTTYDAADLCRVFLNDPERAVQLYKRFLETPESGPANAVIRFLVHHLQDRADPYLVDTVTLKAGGSLRGKLVSQEGGRVRIKLLTGRGSAELEYEESKIERIEREPETIKKEFDRLLNDYDRLLLERRGWLTAEDFLALARQCQTMTDLRVKETAIFFALRLLILQPEHEEAAAILDGGGYSVSRNRLVRKPVLDRRRARDERY